MKVGIDIREVQPGRMTGIGRYTLNMLDHLVAHPGDHTYYLYSEADAPSPVEGDAFVHRGLSAPTRLWFDSITLGSAAQQDEVDVFFSPFVKAPLNAGCPVVNTVHDLMFLRLPEYETPRRWLYHRLFSWRGRRVCRAAAAVVTVSEQSKRDLVELWRVDERKIRVVPNVVSAGFGPETDAARLADVRREHGLQVPYVFYLGNFLPHKNVARLIDAFAQLPQGLRDRYTLALAGGSAAHQDEMARRAADRGIGERVKFLGFAPEEHMRALYSAASLFVFPSLYEGFGLPPLEAMACGAPVAVADATSLPEVVGDAGVLFDPRDVEAIASAMDRVLSDDAFAAELSEKSLERAAMFRPDKIVPRLIEILEEAADSGG